LQYVILRAQELVVGTSWGEAIEVLTLDETGSYRYSQEALTPREVAVLRLIGEGLSAVGIARRLAYSESTIKKTIHQVMRQLGARNRTHAVAIAIRTNLI
jgi:DNA-binding NarL/FixJ family response regulator